MDRDKRPILHGVRILDFTWVLAGPFATRLMADFGAEVIKVQPRFAAEDTGEFDRTYYETWNRNKLGVTLDPGKPEGAELVKRLVGISDAVIENFTPRVMANWGLDYATLKRVRPGIIMLSMSVAGQTGPWRNYTGFAPTVHAMSGLTGLTAFPGGPPLGPGFSYADHVAGLYASLALLGALEYRHKTGKGQYIDLSELEVAVSLLGDSILESGNYGKAKPTTGNESPVAAPHGLYRCRDGRWCALEVSGDEEWKGFKRALGNPAWAEDTRYTTFPGRLINRNELDKAIKEWMVQHTADEVMQCLQSQGVAAGIMQDAADLANDPQLKERGFFIESEDGRTATDTSPIRLSESWPADVRPAPHPGRDNDYVYRELLGMSESELDELKRGGTI